MGISKMILVNVIGPIEEFDRICATYLLNTEMHIENVVGSLDNISGLIPYGDEDTYSEQLSGIEEIYRRAGFSPTVLEDAAVLEAFDGSCETEIAAIRAKLQGNEQKRAELTAKHTENERIISQLKPLLSVDHVDVDRFFHFDYVKFRFGKMPKKSLGTLEEYLNHIDAFFIPTSEDEVYVWGMYFMPGAIEEKIDGIFSSLYFERTRISGKVHGTPREATVALELENTTISKQIADLDKSTKEIVDANLKTLNLIYSQLLFKKKIARIKQYSGHTKDSFYIVAWMNRTGAKQLSQSLSAEPAVTVVFEKPELVDKLNPPTLLKNNFLIRPFELFVKMYGVPGYLEIDPTPIVAVTYFLMFGIMFGDVGQGLCLVVAGFLYGFLKKSNLGKIIGLIGISSVFFGFIYGSVFGHEDIINGLIHPMEKMNFMLVGAVALGVIILAFSMVINIINGIRSKDMKKALFSQNGLAGLIFYLSALSVALLLFLSIGPGVAPWFIGISIVLPLIIIFLQEPLALLVKRKKQWIPKKKGMFFVESLFEVFEIVLSYVTNTMSFIRVGAFALNHVGMMSVVFLLSDMAGSADLIVQVLGNILVIGLEGLIVGIQVLRLEFYEMFSRFYIGNGKEFKNINRQGD